MKIFVSWSGARSKAVALALRKWIPDVLQGVRPWVSEVDIDAGARWSRAIEKELSETSFGILCLTKSNQDAPWLLFESGALAKTLSDTFVCPYLVDLNPVDLAAGPLAQFQAKRSDVEDTWALICAINRSLRDSSLPEESLRRAFDRWWPDLEKALSDLPADTDSAASERSLDDKTDEILSLVRALSRERPSDGIEESDQQELALSGSTLRNLTAAIQAQAGSLEHMLAIARPFRIRVNLGIVTGKHRTVSIEIKPREDLFGTLTAIWAELQDLAEPLEAFTYLWDWIIVRQFDQMPLLIGGAVTRVIPSRTVFTEGEEWTVHRLERPLIQQGDRFGFVRGEPYHWYAHAK
jgi:hypothetical protein